MSATGNLFTDNLSRPLADILRPQKVEDIIGQEHLLGEGRPLRHMLENRHLTSMILWGPPGCGKTTLARVLASFAPECHFESLSAILSGVGDLRRVFEEARDRRRQGMQTILFVDEIHHFNRTQQDSFLGAVEDGSIILVGATTENPSFEMNAALLSRCSVFVLKRLETGDLVQLMRRSERFLGILLPLTLEARDTLLAMSDGDGRTLINMIEALSHMPPEPLLDSDGLLRIIQKRAFRYDKAGEHHFNLISALHKSLRGSDVDAALYWFTRMLEGGENPKYIIRRLIRFASEDIGMADPQALQQAIAARDAYELLGSPEGELCIAQAVTYLATAPKSNAVYVAMNKARDFCRRHGSVMPPKHILNAPTSLMEQEGYGAGYKYDHDLAEGFSGQNYFPENIARTSFYRPVERGFEREIRKRLDWWEKIRKKKIQGTPPENI